MKRPRPLPPRSYRRKNVLKRLRDRASLRRMIVAFTLAVLLNAALLTISSYYILIASGLDLSFKGSPIFYVALCLGLTALMVFFFGLRRARPVHEVNAAMKKVAQGDFSCRVDDEGLSGEIGELVRSYNYMAGELSGIELFRTDFINNFSHEFKTPIVSIRGFARQLQRDDLTSAQRAEYAAIIASESERLANMSSNILLLTKLENQKIIGDKTTYALDEQLRRCLLLLEKQWEEKNLEPRLDLDPLSYEGNEELMEQVWLNLIGNAIKFSNEGGALELSLMRVQNFLLVRVTDHGEGMDEETRRRVFEKFFQGDSAHATRGNGLGLSLAHRIVELCGGRITVDSTPGNGATFSVYLPVEEKA